MAPSVTTRDVPQLTLRAQFDTATLDVEKRTVEVVWTTGAAVKRGGFFTEPFLEELSLDPKHVRMGRLQSGAAPLLNSHRSGDIADILGVIDSAWLTPTEGRAKVRFDSGPQGSDAMRRVGEGTLRNISVGYQVDKYLKVDSKDPVLPTYRAIAWEPHELSLLPIGADAGAATRSGVGMNPCEFIQERTMSDPVPANPSTTNPSPSPAPAPAPAQTTDAQRAEERRLERERITGIQRVARTLNRPETEVTAAIDNGLSLDAFRAAAVEALANATPEQGGTIPFARSGSVAITAGEDQRDKRLRAGENWLLQRSGAAKTVSLAAEKVGQKVDLDPGEFRGLSLVEMARDCLERAGVRTRGMDIMQMVGLAFTHRGAGLNTTSDFPILLENVMHKTLLASYATTPDTWRNWCATGTVSDFRPHPRYRQGSFGVFDQIAEGGEYTNAAIPDGEKQSITAATKGRMVAISRQTIINDDMGALNDIPTRLGRAAALTIEVDAYAYLASNPVMADGVALFHANHGNIGAGGAALSVATVDADRVLMAQQQDPNKKEYLELRPAILLIAVGLGGQARVINQSQYDVDKVANARNQEPNKVVGLYRNIVDTARLAGTTRYSFADPTIAPVIEVAFLNGVETPYLEIQQGWRIDGAEYKARLDYGIGARDYRGVVRNPGA